MYNNVDELESLFCLAKSAPREVGRVGIEGKGGHGQSSFDPAGTAVILVLLRITLRLQTSETSEMMGERRKQGGAPWSA